jgi:hypothetical protein
MTGYTSDQFKAWQKAMGWRNAYAADALGCSLDTISGYRAAGCPQKIALACRALAQMHGLVKNTVSYPWEQETV